MNIRPLHDRVIIKRIEAESKSAFENATAVTRTVSPRLQLVELNDAHPATAAITNAEINLSIILTPFSFVMWR